MNTPPGVTIYGVIPDGQLLLGTSGSYFTYTNDGPVVSISAPEYEALLAQVTGQQSALATLSTSNILTCPPS